MPLARRLSRLSRQVWLTGQDTAMQSVGPSTMGPRSTWGNQSTMQGRLARHWHLVCVPRPTSHVPRWGRFGGHLPPSNVGDPSHEQTSISSLTRHKMAMAFCLASVFLIHPCQLACTALALPCSVCVTRVHLIIPDAASPVQGEIMHLPDS